jgi:hypothetical protein
MQEHQQLTEQEAYEMYDQSLDEQGDVTIGSLSFQPSEIIKELDPIAYRVGFNDFCDYLISDNQYNLEWL